MNASSTAAPLRLHLAEEASPHPPVGRSAVPLQTFVRRGPAVLFDVDGWPLLRHHATVAFGDGGSLKSYLALHAAGRLAQQGARVLFADWELDGDDHLDRLHRLFGSDVPTVYYIRCDAPLVTEVRVLAREVQRLGIDYLVCDSVGAATAGPPEGAEQALGYWRALRQLGVRGSLHVAHVNKSETGDMKPFGSVFWHNQARMTWFVKREASSLNRLRLVNRKANLTGLQPEVGFQFAFGPERTTVSRVPVDDVSTVEPGSLSTRQRIVALIQAGGGQPVTLRAIAEALGAKEETVGRVIRRYRHLFVTLPTGDVALATGRSE